MGINSRKKGQRGEKKAKEVLQKWTGMEFARVPASGGLRWKKADNITGDVVCTDPLHRFDFCIESKNYKDINFSHLIIPNVNSRIIDEFWVQCTSDAERGMKIPLLLMRYDNIRPGDFFFAMMYFRDFKLLRPLIQLNSRYLKVGKLVILSSLDLFNSDYTKVKQITEKLIQTRYGTTRNAPKANKGK